ncbi:MAG: metallophosphoesterase [Desulfobacterales bacterium]|nr:metallophosphoesterase [Desulfobacterales bacterium]
MEYNNLCNSISKIRVLHFKRKYSAKQKKIVDKGTITIKKINRRKFLAYSARLTILALLGFGFYERTDLHIEYLHLSFPNLPDSFDGYRICHISDLHSSFWVKPEYLLEVVNKINELNCNSVVITGDIITGAVNSFWKRWMPVSKNDYIANVIDVLSHLKTENKLAVLGNHDQWAGKETELRLVNELQHIGITVLRNHSVKLTRSNASIYFIGTDDLWSSSYDFAKAIQNVPVDEFKILLSHNPDVRRDIRTDMKVDLTLCGHTHGGQVRIPFLSNFLIPIDNPATYLAGLVKERYGYTYVNRGIGTLVFPFRIGSSPEITCLTLKKSSTQRE